MAEHEVRPSARTLAKVPPGTFRQADAARAGLSARSLYRLRDAGHLEVVGRGLYRRAGEPPVDDDLLEVATRSPRATICLTSALARHGLVDAVPARVHVAVPRGAYAARVQTAVRWHVFDSATFDVGRDLLPVEGTDQQIGLYSAERSIVDVFRLRGQEGYEVGVEALRAWLRRRGSHPAELLRIAQRLPRAQGPLRQALEYLS
ncbi:type IV toxin-antitoxin system AbiEi family antitoxin domain-containing protein [Kineococcus arenarius]|uniref:type IV toxin-antitoxin system AbiEi family antitoxin domain-containing protein n=1 Tax=unclassified Kineococcus TaxID=2621656 RepID=UPI003D7C9810